MLFINTRPADRSSALTQNLTEQGYDVINLPLLELKPRPFGTSLDHMYKQLGDVQMIVVVSPTAVEIGFQYLQQSGLTLDSIKHIEWIAVGKTTALHLEKYGVQSHIPEVETSEGMLSLPIFQQIPHLKKIAFWRGEGGRQFMMQQCLKNNVDVLNFVLYERGCPKDTQHNIRQIAEKIGSYKSSVWTCISSEASWKNWVDLLQSYPHIIRDCHYLVLGDRLYNLLNDDKNNLKLDFEVKKINSLDPSVVMQSLVG